MGVVGPAYRRLGAGERAQIEVLWRDGRRVTQIARLLGRPTSTISREIKRNGVYRYDSGIAYAVNPLSRSMAPGARGVYAKAYVGSTAQRKARGRVRLKPQRPKLTDPQLCARVATLLADRLSPRQVSAQLRKEHPGQARWQVSHETIYKALFIQGRGELRRQVARQVALAGLAAQEALRTGRTRRKPHPDKIPGVAFSRRGNRPWIAGWHISSRPAQALDRAVPGHWEGDLLIGAGGHTAIITCVERASRFVLLGALPHGRDSSAVIQVLTGLIATLPQQLRGSLTWDQGVELAQVARFRVATGCPVYFADPHSPWQRGSNENTNGLLRQYFPKGKHSFAHTTQADLDTVAAQLNRRPRQTLDWDTPAERLNKLLVALTP